MRNVVADNPGGISLISSDAVLTLKGVNLPIFANTANNVTVNGMSTQAVEPASVVDCSQAFVDFPADGGSDYFGSSWSAAQ